MALSKDQQKEYNTVVLAALLHDIGKFLNRLKESRKKHPLESVRFIEELLVKIIAKKEEISINLNLLKTLVQCHHESDRYFPKDQLVQEIKDEHQKALAYMVSRADNFSSSERDDRDDERGDWYKKARLYSLFSLIDVKDVEERALKDRYYQLQEFSSENIFPIDKEYVDINEYHYNRLYDEFAHELETFSPVNFNELFNGLWSIFKKILWSVPSDTWKKKADITLFDHLSTTSAIAASLYLFHRDDINKDEIVKDEEEKFILVGGDLSGIQEFLFEINQRNPRKLSKTLRGRSFMLSLLVEIAALKILKTLNLPHSAKLMSSGGRFIILAPNREDVKEQLEKLAVEIEEAFFEKFLGKLTLNINFSTALSGKDFKLGEVKNKINEANYGLIEQKVRKNHAVLRQGKYQAIVDRTYDEFIKNDGECDFCGVYPKAVRKEQANCTICNDAERLGKDIITRKFIIFSERPEAYNFLGIGVVLADKYQENILAYSIEVEDDKKGNEGEDKKGDEKEVKKPEESSKEPYRGTIPYFIANYLPDNRSKLIREDNEEEESLCYFCKRNDLFDEEQCPKENRKIFKETHLSFQCIASYTPLKNNGKGVDKLAVFKADIDNLGYIIQHGFKKIKAGDDYSIYSVSRFTFLSRMIDAFFQSWLRHTIKEKYPMIYTVYSGGDDLFLIGPWYNIIEFALYFRQEFSRFFADNPDITLSAGISLFSPHSPVTLAVERSEENLEKSKNVEGKDAINFFDTTVKWHQLEELIEFADFLDERVNLDSMESKINVSFIYRLFKYRRLFMNYKQKGYIEGLRFHSLMNYDVVRNIVIKEKDGDEPINKEELARLLPLYETGRGLKEELLRNLKIPLYITLFKNRGGQTND